ALQGAVAVGEVGEQRLTRRDEPLGPATDRPGDATDRGNLLGEGVAEVGHRTADLTLNVFEDALRGGPALADNDVGPRRPVAAQLVESVGNIGTRATDGVVDVLPHLIECVGEVVAKLGQLKLDVVARLDARPLERGKDAAEVVDESLPSLGEP